MDQRCMGPHSGKRMTRAGMKLAFLNLEESERARQPVAARKGEGEEKRTPMGRAARDEIMRKKNGGGKYLQTLPLVKLNLI